MNGTLKVRVLEEYGYAAYDFMFWGSPDELAAQWKQKGMDLLREHKVRTLYTFSNRKEAQVATQLYPDENDYDATIIKDQEEESGLYLDGVHYPCQGWEPVNGES